MFGANECLGFSKTPCPLPRSQNSQFLDLTYDGLSWSTKVTSTYIHTRKQLKTNRIHLIVGSLNVNCTAHKCNLYDHYLYIIYISGYNPVFSSFVQIIHRLCISYTLFVVYIEHKHRITQLTSSWNPFKLWMLDGEVRNVPNGEVVNSTKSSGPLVTAAGMLSPPPQNFNITGSRVV